MTKYLNRGGNFYGTGPDGQEIFLSPTDTIDLTDAQLAACHPTLRDRLIPVPDEDLVAVTKPAGKGAGKGAGKQATLAAAAAAAEAEALEAAGSNPATEG